jgi:hypothetical protein
VLLLQNAAGPQSNGLLHGWPTEPSRHFVVMTLHTRPGSHSSNSRQVWPSFALAWHVPAQHESVQVGVTHRAPGDEHSASAKQIWLFPTVPT